MKILSNIEELKNKFLSSLSQLQADPSEEVLHHFRVATRRLLANAKLKRKDMKAMKKVFRTSSPIRDIDTLVLRIEKIGSMLSDVKEILCANNKVNHSKLLSLIQESNIADSICKAVPSAHHQSGSSTLAEEFELFSELLLKLLKKSDSIDKDELHSLRKKLKKIRYRFENIEQMPSDETLSSFKQLQDVLGYINDRHAWQKILAGKEFDKIECIEELKEIIRQESDASIEELKTIFSEEFCKSLKCKISK
jgi:CHAD domain-containing protein